MWTFNNAMFAAKQHYPTLSITLLCPSKKWSRVPFRIICANVFPSQVHFLGVYRILRLNVRALYLMIVPKTFSATLLRFIGCKAVNLNVHWNFLTRNEKYNFFVNPIPIVSRRVSNHHVASRNKHSLSMHLLPLPHADCMKYSCFYLAEEYLYIFDYCWRQCLIPIPQNRRSNRWYSPCKHNNNNSNLIPSLILVCTEFCVSLG